MKIKKIQEKSSEEKSIQPQLGSDNKTSNVSELINSKIVKNVNNFSILKKPRGTKDVYGFKQILKQQIEDNLRQIAELFNYQKIETPIFEYLEVFKRSVGETSDIVNKELFQFIDKSQRNLVLRPEGTAAIVRALIENNLLVDVNYKKVYYQGSMFRYENPQYNRQRQFNQFGIENFEKQDPYVDAQIIIMAQMILNSFNIASKLIINSLGDQQTRTNYSQALVAYLKPFTNQLEPISLKRLTSNPLRILDDKLEAKKDFIKNAPKISNFWSSSSQIYFQKILKILDQYEIEYQIKDSLVRGLDYYTDVIFEFLPLEKKDESDASQLTLIAGGRYDNLVANMGGPNISGVGFALGIERLLNILVEQVDQESIANGYLIYIANLTLESQQLVLDLALELRSLNFKVDWNVSPQKLLKIFDQTKTLNISAFVILGQKEINEKIATIKIGSQTKSVKLNQVSEYLKQHFSQSNLTKTNTFKGK